jgi:hypothetical protein
VDIMTGYTSAMCSSVSKIVNFAEKLSGRRRWSELQTRKLRRCSNGEAPTFSFPPIISQTPIIEI